MAPNILWICSDQQRYDTLVCMGNEWVRTPNLDRLAAGGVLFEQAFCQNPVCTPSRASFLTGRYPRTTRARQNGQSIPADEALVTRTLSEAGYRCGLSGKLHLSACHPDVCPVTERRIDDGYAEFHWSHHPRADWPTNEYSRWLKDRGQEWKRQPVAGTKHVQTSMPEEYHQTTWCIEKAMEFVRESSSDGRPWLFSVNMYDPHPPFDPPRAYLERYLERIDDIPLPNCVEGEWRNKPVWQHPAKASEIGPSDHRMMRAAYWAMCDLIDTQVGRMLGQLEESGGLDNTIVIYMSDHGEMLGDHGLYWKGPFMYEGAVHVPLIISWPGKFSAGKRVQGLVELVDIAPTLLEAAGLPRNPGMQGKSLMPLLTGQTEVKHREDVYCEFYNSMVRQPKTYATMVRTGQWKLVAFHGTEPGELYDLATDPSETHNLWADPRHAGVKCEMLKRLCDRMAQTVDPLPAREAQY